MNKPEKLTAAELNKKAIPHCSKCGSSQVFSEAYARWNERFQRWEVSDLLEGNSACNHCGQDCEIKWRLT